MMALTLLEVGLGRKGGSYDISTTDTIKVISMCRLCLRIVYYRKPFIGYLAFISRPHIRPHKTLKRSSGVSLSSLEGVCSGLCKEGFLLDQLTRP